jgi:hypothetical protein
MHRPKSILLLPILFYLLKTNLVYGDACLNLISIRLKKVVDQSTFDFSQDNTHESLSMKSYPDSCFYIVNLTLTQQSFEKTKEARLEYVVSNSIEFKKELINNTLASEDMTLKFAERFEIKKLAFMFLGLLGMVTIAQVWTLGTVLYKG